ncbi:MAG: hypothetical protein ACKOWF_11855 [Chloroflexota bacterium]
MKVFGSLLALLLLLGGGAAAPATRPVAAQEASGLLALLPPASAIPVANVETVDGTQDLFAIAGTFPDAAIAMRDLNQWGFKGNAWRDYVAAWWEDPYLPNRAEISLHQFRSVAGAEAALAPYANSRITALGLAAAARPPLGDRSLLLSGAVEGGNEDTIYFAEDGILARVTVVSPAGDPYPWAKQIARSLRKAILATAPVVVVSAEPGATAVPGGHIAIPGAGPTAVPSTSGNVAISNPPPAPAAPAPPPVMQRMLDRLRDEPFGIEKVGEDICCVSFAEASALGLAGEIGTLSFRAKPTGYITTLNATLRYTVFETPDAAAAAWNGLISDRKQYLDFREYENPATGEPPVVIFSAQGRGDTATATGFLLVDNVILSASVRSSDWQALLPSIAQRNANSLLLAGYRHLVALFAE